MSSLPHRPAIDGLRAVAVLAVFLFHLSPERLPGGFLGVDVFFVISGYLITLILARAERENAVRLLDFYQRRIARIVPGFAVVAGATLCAAAAWYSDQDFASAGAVLLAASFWMANVKALLQGNYFELSADAQPFLHFWSLSVEEQFYAVFPVAFVLGRRWLGRGMGAALCGVCVGSWGAGLALASRHPEWVFYLLPTRAWELAAGAVLAVCEADTVSREVRQAALWRKLEGVGWVGMGVPFFLKPPDSLSLQWMALSTVVGTVLVLGAWRAAGAGERPGLSERLMAHRTMVWVGRRSFALYLVHWPVFSMVDYAGFWAGMGVRTVLKVVLSVLGCELLHRAVEQPLRGVLAQSGKRRICFAVALGAALILGGAGLAVRRSYYVTADRRTVDRGGLVFSGAAGRRVVLMGDSNASMYGKWFRDFCQGQGWELTVLSMPACDPLPAISGNGGDLWSVLQSVVAKKQPDVVVLACRWSDKLEAGPDRLQRAVDRLLSDAGSVVLVNQVPDLPAGANREGIRRGWRPPFFEAAEERRKRERANGWVAALRSARIRVVDAATALMDPDGSVIFEGKRPYYQDNQHLSGHGVERVGPSLEEALFAGDAVRPLSPQ